MESVLLVKTSSLGDVIHNLPVVNDIHRAWSGVTVDWVVEESFAPIARLHAGVTGVIPVAIRRWRRTLGRRATWCEIARFVQCLRRKDYGAVIDAQGLLKSALITAGARGIRYGLDWSSSREPLRPFYDCTVSVPWTQHAVERNRMLAAQALGYQASSAPSYGIQARAAAFPWLPTRPYFVFLHASSATRKLWPEAAWLELGTQLGREGFSCVLPWGDAVERSRSMRLAARIPGAVVPPALALDELACLLAGARGCTGVDTGATHLAGALAVPTVGIYGATDPAATGLYGCPRAVSLGSMGQFPTVDEVRAALQQLVNGK
jgi:heptosyltransferase-1